jgi:hypothetical protein
VLRCRPTVHVQDSRIGFSCALVQVRLPVVTVQHVKRFRFAKSVMDHVPSQAYQRRVHLYVLEVDSL